jgi:hypothetical protein
MDLAGICLFGARFVREPIWPTPRLSRRTARDYRSAPHFEIQMIPVMNVLRCVVVGSALLLGTPVQAAEEFPFGLEMMLDVARQPGSKRLPTLDIGDAGETSVELWCKGGKGQFSVAGDTVIFAVGAMEARDCPAARAQLDDELLATLSEVTNWKRRGDVVSFIGAKSLRFRLNTN